MTFSQSQRSKHISSSEVLPVIMSNTGKCNEPYLLRLCQRARDLGASQAIALQASDIVLDERALLKCLVPICPHYGVDLMCPPSVLPLPQFREILKRYESAILIKLDVPLNDPPGSDKKTEKQPEKPTAEQMKTLRDAKKKLHDIVCQMESLCFGEGYHFAAGLVGGSCSLCKECVGIKSGLPCRHPFKARPAMEAMGIEVIATAKKAGLDLSFGQSKSRSWVGLVLVF